MTIASVFVSFYAGALNDAGDGGPQYLTLVSLPWAVLACFPIAFNMMADERQDDICKTDTALFMKQSKIFTLAIVIGVTVMWNIMFGVVDPLKPYKLTRLFSTNFLMCGVLGASYWLIDRRIAHINVYLYLCRLCTFGLGYPLQQFYTTDPKMCDDPTMNLPGFT